MSIRIHKIRWTYITAAILLPTVTFSSRLGNQGTGSPCYKADEEGRQDLNKPQKCMPAFENVVLNRQVEVSPEYITCGQRSRTEYCIQTHGIYRECDFCDERDPSRRHPAEFLTDVDTDFNRTWWQSVTMLEDVHTKNVNLTVHLGKAYDITYVRLKFRSLRPASFSMYKKNRLNPEQEDPYPNEGWIPWQYYSITCRDTYKLTDSTSIIQPRNSATKINEDRALCTSEFSDMTPLTGGNVAFSTLEGRPSAFNYEYSPELQEWVSATDIRISFQRLNTFGDDVFGDPKVLRSYYYAVTDFTVGGRCQCNGHATHCIPKDSSNPSSPTVCLCQHGTDGPNCEACLPDYWDRPWRRATSDNANECKRFINYATTICVCLASIVHGDRGSGKKYLQETEERYGGPWFTGSSCECNGWSSRCRFNEQLYMESGHGGECMDCEGNRDGPHCERCKPNHFFSPFPDNYNKTPCEPCNCDPTGSKTLQCGDNGRCDCKPGVTGNKCDQCKPNFWNFSPLGCKDCGCLPEGSVGNQAACDTTSSNCYCKQNVEGQRCDRCKAGHFHIDKNNEFGCTPCFCYGHTSECELSGGYTKSFILSDFSRSSEDWTSIEEDQSLPLRYDGINKLIGVQSVPSPGSPTQSRGAYFHAPKQFLGDQRASYNQELTFRLRINDMGPRPDRYDVVIEGGGARETSIAVSITKQNNPIPSYEMQDYRFRLHENPEFGWSPSLSSKDFMSILANVSAIKIRGTYVPNGMGFLDEVKLGTASRRGVAGPQATWIERCNCPEGYQGQYCELCKPGFHHENNGGPFARCVPCSCNGHADICDSESGKCECKYNTDGHHCERCARGYYGNALLGDSGDCQPCPCPEGGACLEIPGNPESPICIECPDGRTGPRCELCKDGYFGDPTGQFGEVQSCQPCECNDNVDPNAIGNCDRTTGECLRCVDNTDGFNCQQCKSGFFGDALALKNPGNPPNCQHCQCYPVGTNLDLETFLPICNGFTGDCSCKPHVVGRNCEKCANGYFNIESGEGCEPCNCDSIGSKNETCHVETGQCNCNPGVTGQRCDTCMAFHYGFSQEGCKPCDCDPSGSTDLQCDLVSGQCPCRDKVEGRKCDRCMENTKSRQIGPYGGEKICEPCDDCYNLVLDSANVHRRNLEALENLLQQIAENPEPVGDDFEYQLRGLRVRVTQTLSDAQISSQNEEGGTLRDRLEQLRSKLEEVISVVMEANHQIETAKQHGVEADAKVANAKSIIENAKDSLKAAQRQLETQGQDALRKAQEKSKKFGRESDKMSAIAREAGDLAEKLVEDASEITSIGKQASNTSIQAYEMTRQALEEQHHEANEINVLDMQVKEMGDNLRRVKSLADVSLREADEAYKQALIILRQAKGLVLPEVYSDSMIAEASNVQAEAEMIRQDAERLVEENEELLRETQDKRAQLDDLLDRANLQQQEVDVQLAEMDELRNKALNAVERGNDILKDALATLETLRAFEDHVDENQLAAKEAMSNADYIEETIRDAEMKTDEARKALSGADTYANLSLSVAKHAKDIAEEASINADRVVNESAFTREQAAELSSSVASLEAKMEETKTIIDVKEEIAEKDGELARTALSKANEAQIKARDAVKKVSFAKMELENIAAILSTVAEPEPGLLEDLERRVQIAEEKYKAADLEIRLKELEEAKQRQASQVRDLEKELIYMHEESRNIREIRESLPDFCPKNNELCIEDQC